MPHVSRLSGTTTEDEGFAVTTQSGGSTYRYVLRVTEERVVLDDEDEDPTPGTVELTERTKDGELDDGEVTEAVREAVEDYGYEVA